MEVDIKQATENDIDALYAIYDILGKEDAGYFETCFEKECLILISSFPASVVPLRHTPLYDSPSTSSCDSPSTSSCDLIAGPMDSSVKPKNDKGRRIDIGFGVLNFSPKYNLYKKLDIPEIQDLNVISDARQQGVATQMVSAFENIARDQGYEQIGISVGLTKDYGAAQRLYTKLGYVPDGYGVTYDREPITAGASYPMDDDLALMMVKSLRELLPK